jgi:transcriptional regulator with XRE-family HTH domain
MEVVRNTDKKRAPTGWLEVGQRIKSLREQRGLTRDAIADRTSVDATSLWRIESGSQWVSPRTLQELSEVLQVSVAELFPQKEAKRGPDLKKISAEDSREFLLGRIVIALGGLDDSKLRGLLKAVELAARAAAVKSEDLKTQDG